jgi:hypothetical protein
MRLRNVYVFLWLALSAAVCSVPAYSQSKTQLECTVDRKEVSHDLEVKEQDGEIVSFSYLSSVPTPGLATNCTINSRMAKGPPTVSGDVTTYPMWDGDTLSITKTKSGLLFDMTKMEPIKYCSGPIAQKILIRPGSSKCVLMR